MAKHFEENLAGKLDEFSNQAAFIEGWLTKEEKKFQAMGGIAPNLEVAMKQKPRVEVEWNCCKALCIMDLKNGSSALKDVFSFKLLVMSNLTILNVTYPNVN